MLWKNAGCTSELDYTEQTSWLLFLKYLDALEADRVTAAALIGKIKNRIQCGYNLREIIDHIDDLRFALQERTFYGKEKNSLLHQAFAGEL